MSNFGKQIGFVGTRLSSLVCSSVSSGLKLKYDLLNKGATPLELYQGTIAWLKKIMIS